MADFFLAQTVDSCSLSVDWYLSLHLYLGCYFLRCFTDSQYSVVLIVVSEQYNLVLKSGKNGLKYSYTWQTFCQTLFCMTGSLFMIVTFSCPIIHHTRFNDRRRDRSLFVKVKAWGGWIELRTSETNISLFISLLMRLINWITSP